jgi:hypothetical protein
VAPQLRTVEVAEPQTTNGQLRYARMMQAYSSLGIGSSNSRVQRGQSLEDEVDKYLAVPSREEWDSIAFWEV